MPQSEDVSRCQSRQQARHVEIFGEVSERLMEPVLKTGDVLSTSVGSNPTLSASTRL